MRVALIGPPQSGKSTLFAAVAEAGGSNVDLSRPDQPHLAVVKVPDERLDVLAEHFHPKKIVPAELEFLDLPGLNLSDEAGRNRAKTHWAAMRQADMLVFVVRAFDDATVPAYRDRVDPESDVRELLDEMLFADLDQVLNRIEKLTAALKKPTGDHKDQQRELELMERLRDTLENEKTIADAVASDTEGKLIRSFAFLSQKPMLVVLNRGEEADAPAPERLADTECLALSARIEEEIASLDPDERTEFLSEMGIESPARDRMVRACYRALGLVSFLTYGEDECRAWTVPSETEAVEAAGEIHSDISRGFIRAETVSYDDYIAAGDMKAAKAAGNVRLEGKTYRVQDGDMITFRFNV